MGKYNSYRSEKEGLSEAVQVPATVLARVFRLRGKGKGFAGF
jgi:hypothetical protein